MRFQSHKIIFAVATAVAIFIPASGYAATAAEQEIIAQLQAQSRTLQERLDALLLRQPQATPTQEIPLAEDQRKAFQEKLDAALRQPQAPSAQQPPAKAAERTTPPSGDTLATSSSFNLSRDLSFGMRGNLDVTNLQKFLSERGYYSGPPTGNFLLLTLNAVKKFQSANGISPTGYFGPRSRAMANSSAIIKSGNNDGGAVNNNRGSLSIEPSSAQIGTGERIMIKAMFAPPRPACLNATPRCLVAERAPYAVDASFESSDSSIAAVDAEFEGSHQAYVRGVSVGTVVITASYNNFTSAFIAKAKITVTAPVSSH